MYSVPTFLFVNYAHFNDVDLQLNIIYNLELNKIHF